MKRLLLFPLLLAACDSPAPAMMGAEATQVSIDNTSFTVRVRGNRAEAIRLNTMAFPTIGEVYPNALAAMEQASGCTVIEDTLRGDQAVMRADLAC
ncbi:MAG: hypothetical protein ACU0AX_02470 [Roseovarius sp.]|uniref:hypothetical protein n=1 Tax=Roseovarius sp. TaxID=1486281 RepID=UPI004058C068